MASKYKQEDPWAGFVDVLSNILMVVVFLVVILGMAIFAISQQVTKVAVEKAVQAERAAKEAVAQEEATVTQAEPAELPVPAAVAPIAKAQAEELKPAVAPTSDENLEPVTAATPAQADMPVRRAEEKPATEPAPPAQETLAQQEMKITQAELALPPAVAGTTLQPVPEPVAKALAEEPQPSAAPSPVEKPQPEAPAAPVRPAGQEPGKEPAQAASVETGASGPFEASAGLRARQADDVAGNTNLSVRSRDTKSNREIEIASEEAKTEDAPVVATLAEAFLTLKFSRGSVKIDPAASGEIQAFLGQDKSLNGNRIEIRAFAQSTIGSVSEARRIAYYRAMQTRMELIKSGIAPAKLEVKIRESVAPEEFDVVRIFAKP